MMRGQPPEIAWVVGAVVACATLLHVVRCGGVAPAGGGVSGDWPRPSVLAYLGAPSRPEKLSSFISE